MECKGPLVSKDQEYLIWQDLYMKGDDLQKLSVIQALPQLLKTDNNATVSRIIPKIQQELPNSSSEFHIVTSKIFKLLIEMNLPVNLLRPVLQGIESKDPIVCNAWIDTLLSVIPSLPDAAIKNEVLPSAVKMSQLNRAVYYRVASCKMLGQISVHPKMSALEVKKDILPVVQGLCQDCFYEVRAAMCTELPNIAQGLGGDNLVKSSILPGLVELSTDENMSVRAAAVDAVVLMIPFLNSDTIKQTIIRLVKQLCVQSSKTGDYTFPVIARVYGMLLNNLQHHLPYAENVWFLEFFKQLARRGLIVTPAEVDMDPGLGVTCREYCAYNLPAVTFFTVTKIPSDINIWYSVFKDLAGDPCYIVRKTVAGCIHEIARILGNENKCITPDIVKLLRDDAEEVLDSLVPNIGVTLELLCNSGVLSRENATQSSLEVGRALLKCQVELFKCHNWRRKMAFLQQLEHLPNCLPSDFIHQHFTSVVLKLTVDGRARPVRSQAARTMLVFLRYNIKENHRKWIRENLINLLCESPCCYTRHIFINMCSHAFDIFSTKYFKENFFASVLKLTEDPVSTVRLCVVNLGPALKNMLVLPLDRPLQVKLENAFSKMESMETDKEVMATLKRKLKEMRTAQVNRQDVLIEEKRRVEEEERIQQGKIIASPRVGAQEITTGGQAASSRPIAAVTVARSGSMTKRPTTATTASDMSFLGQHFYIDAGVALPEEINSDNNSTEESIANIEQNMRSLRLNKCQSNTGIKKSSDDYMEISTISMENTNVENMSDEDLKELETSTTNITDDVKANIQKISLSKGTSRSKVLTDSVKRRNKRYSCVFLTDQSQTTSSSTALKRRSLNIGSTELSKIPVSFKSLKKAEENTTIKKTKSGSVQHLYSSCSKSNILDPRTSSSRIKLALKPDTIDMGNKAKSKEKFMDNGNIISNIHCSKVQNGIEVKENVPVSNSIKTNVPNKCTKENIVTKVSNLPVLIRRAQSEVRK